MATFAVVTAAMTAGAVILGIGVASAQTPTGASTSGKNVSTKTAAASGTSVSSAKVSSAVMTSQIPPVPAVTGTVLGTVTQNARLGGRDGGSSAELDGKSYWIFDDTTLKNPWGFHSNSAAVTADLKASDGIDLTSGTAFSTAPTTPATVLPSTPAQAAFAKAHQASTSGCTAATDIYCGAGFAAWPGPAFADPSTHKIYFWYGEICRGGGVGTFCHGFVGKGLGEGLAEIDPATGTVTRVTPTGRTAPAQSIEGADPTLFYAPGETGYVGNTVVDTPTGPQLYLLGGCSTACSVATVPVSQVTDLNAYRYWDGSAWTADKTKAAHTGPTTRGFGNNLFYSPAVHAWVSMHLKAYSNQVVYQVAGQPMGPWSKPVYAFSVPKAKSTYGFMVHTEYSRNKGATQYATWFGGSQGLAKLHFTPATTP